MEGEECPLGDMVCKFGEFPERSNGADCKSVGSAFEGSNPPLPNQPAKSLRCIDLAGVLFLELPRTGTFKTSTQPLVADNNHAQFPYSAHFGFVLKNDIIETVSHFK